jgi:hypothetical protein
MTDYRVARGEAPEGQMTAAIETYPSQVPSSIYHGLALSSMAVSEGFQFAGEKDTSLFMGQWVKQHGSDGTHESDIAEEAAA